MMPTLVLTVHYSVAIILIIAVLLQSGKGADIGAAFGGGSSQTVFGGRGPATFLNKLTAVVAGIFLLTSLTLAEFSKSQTSKSVVDTLPATEEAAPAEPGKAPVSAPAAEEPASKK